MAAYTYTTSAVEEAALAAQLADANAAIVAQNAQNVSMSPPVPPLPLLDKAGYLNARIVDVLASYGATHQQVIARTCVMAFMAASAANRTQILTAIGMAGFSSLVDKDLANALVTIGLPNFMALPIDQQNAVFALVGLKS